MAITRGGIKLGDKGGAKKPCGGKMEEEVGKIGPLDGPKKPSGPKWPKPDLDLPDSTG